MSLSNVVFCSYVFVLMLSGVCLQYCFIQARYLTIFFLVFLFSDAALPDQVQMLDVDVGIPRDDQGT